MNKLQNRRQPSPNDVPREGLVPIRQASPLSGVPARTIARWAQQELIEAQKFGPRIWYVNLDDVRRVAATLKPGPKPQKTSEGE